MNNRFRNLEKIEFVITDACTGKCKHCSEGDHKLSGESIDPAIAADSVRRICEKYAIKTVMVFGGEPLLYPQTVYKIISTAKELDIPRRQVITNGYFSKSEEKIREVAKTLYASGVNDLLLSVDAFHQETIPLPVVKKFAREAKNCGIPIRLQPAWLISASDGNSYNLKTREILAEFSYMSIPVGDGNVIFPEGNAKRYLYEYFADNVPENPYNEDPCDIKCISFSANGDVLSDNVYKRGIIEIMDRYSSILT